MYFLALSSALSIQNDGRVSASLFLSLTFRQNYSKSNTCRLIDDKQHILSFYLYNFNFCIKMASSTNTNQEPMLRQAYAELAKAEKVGDYERCLKACNRSKVCLFCQIKCVGLGLFIFYICFLFQSSKLHQMTQWRFIVN